MTLPNQTISNVIKNLENAGFIAVENNTFECIDVEHPAFPNMELEVSLKKVIWDKVDHKGIIEDFLELIWNTSRLEEN